MSEFNPLVSIVIPVYNGENYLNNAIESALGQTYKNIEVIVVNDGSKDNTEQIALSWSDKIRYFPKENGGVATALNLAIENAKGEYISWLSHDDMYYPNKIERQIKEISYCKNDKLLMFSNFDSLYVNENIKTESPIEKLIDPKDDALFNSLKILMISCVHGCSVLIPKKCFTEAGYFDVNLKTTQDYDLWYKFIKHGYRFHLIKEALGLSRLHDNQGSKTQSDIQSVEIKKLNEDAVELFKDELKNFPKKYISFFSFHLRRGGYYELVEKYQFLNIEYNKTAYLFYKLTIRPILKLIYGKKKVKEQYDLSFMSWLSV